MATIFGAIENLIHDTAEAIIDSQITKKLSDISTGTVSAGFGFVDDTLKIVRDATTSKPPAPTP